MRVSRAFLGLITVGATAQLIIDANATEASAAVPVALAFPGTTTVAHDATLQPDSTATTAADFFASQDQLQIQAPVFDPQSNSTDATNSTLSAVTTSAPKNSSNTGSITSTLTATNNIARITAVTAIKPVSNVVTAATGLPIHRDDTHDWLAISIFGAIICACIGFGLVVVSFNSNRNQRVDEEAS